MTKTESAHGSAPSCGFSATVGDYFAEFMAGGTAVVCGHEPQNPRRKTSLAIAPAWAWSAGASSSAGPYKGFSENDAQTGAEIDDDDLGLADREPQELLEQDRARVGCWRRLAKFVTSGCRSSAAFKTPFETARARSNAAPWADFRASDVWDAELGRGGMIGDLTNLGSLARARRHRAPAKCAASCPCGRTASTWPRASPAVPRACPCRSAGSWSATGSSTRPWTWPWPTPRSRPRSAATCARTCAWRGVPAPRSRAWPPSTSPSWARRGTSPSPRRCPRSPARKIAVIGGGPAGISVAWQIRMKGHEAVVFDMAKTPGRQDHRRHPQQPRAQGGR